MLNGRIPVLYDAFHVKALCFCDCNFAQGLCVLSFAVIGLGKAKEKNVWN